MQCERAVGLTAVQIDRDRGDRDVSQRQGCDDVAPPTERHQPRREKREVIKRHRITPAAYRWS